MSPSPPSSERTPQRWAAAEGCGHNAAEGGTSSLPPSVCCVPEFPLGMSRLGCGTSSEIGQDAAAAPSLAAPPGQPQQGKVKVEIFFFFSFLAGAGREGRGGWGWNGVSLLNKYLQLSGLTHTCETKNNASLIRKTQLSKPGCHWHLCDLPRKARHVSRSPGGGERWFMFHWSSLCTDLLGQHTRWDCEIRVFTVRSWLHFLLPALRGVFRGPHKTLLVSLGGIVHVKL